jgi:hypothetical protein
MSRRFIYTLLNPDDEDNINMLTTDSPQLKLFAKTEALNFKEEKPMEGSTRWLQIKSTSLSVIISILTMILAMSKISDKLFMWLKQILVRRK